MPMIGEMSSLLAAVACLVSCGAQEDVAAEKERPAVRIANVEFTTREVEVAREDEDGHVDLVVATGGDVSVYAGDGTGALDRRFTVRAGADDVEMAVADLDGDGHLDVASAGHETQLLTLLLGDGEGRLAPAPASPLLVDVRPHLHVVTARDFDGDGVVDLVVDDRDGEGLRLLRGTGDGTFDLPGAFIAVGGDPYRGLAAGDLDGDGRPDIVTPNPHEVGVTLSGGREPYELERAAPVAASEPFGVALLDLDGDGNLDLVSASGQSTGVVELFLGDREGGFRPHSESPLRTAAGAKRIQVGDFDGDGRADAAVSNYQSPDVLLVFGGPSPLRTGYVPAGGSPWEMAAADLDGDGADELVVVDDTGGRLTIFSAAGGTEAR